MLDEVLIVLKNKLNSYFKLITSSSEDKVIFPDGSKADATSFTLNHVTLALINIEEEKMIRQANRFEGVIKNGIKTEINPAIGINATVVFISRFSDYEQTLKFLSLILAFFQKIPVLDRYNTPDLPAAVDKIRIELLTMPIAQQNEVWSSLRTTYVPSVIYRIGVVIYNDTDSLSLAIPIQNTGLKTTHL